MRITLMLVAGLSLLPVAAQAQELFETVELADGVWATMVRAPHAPSQYSNSLIVIGQDGVLIVDTRHSPSSARELVATVRDLTPLPVTRVVNTHRHSDHVYGNQILLEEFPDVELIGHPATVAWLESEGAAQLQVDRDAATERVERWRGWLSAGETDAGRVLSEADIEEVKAAIARTETSQAELEAVRITPPRVGVADSLIIHDGERTLRLLHPGPAHTQGDLVIHLPDEGILWTGDLTEQGFPYFGHGTVLGWAAAMERLEGLDATRILSAHGRIRADRSMFETQRRFLRALVNGVRREHMNGATVSEIVEAIRLTEFQEFFAFGDAEAAGGYAEFVEETVRRCVAEITGTAP